MASISSLGVGSGLDIGGLVKQLVSAEGAPKTARFNRRETLLQTQITAMGTVKSALADFQSTLGALSSAAAFTKISARSSNTSLFTATAADTANAGTYAVEVLQKAQGHRVSTKAADAVADLTTVIGTGTITFDFGSYSGGVFTANAAKPSKTVTVTDGTLTGMRDAINNANIGVHASIINDGTGYRLVMNSETGANNAMRISVSGDSDGNNTDAAGLSLLTYDGATAGIQNLEQTVDGVAQDAQVRVDGITVTSASNTITGVIDGVTIDLQKAEVGTVSTLTVSKDTADITKKVSAFVEGFNTLVTALNGLSFYDKDTKESGLLIGDAAIRGIDTSVRRLLGSVVGNLSDPYTTLAQVGIKTERDGTLSFDSSKLIGALNTDPDQVARLFAGGAAQTVTHNSFTFGSVPAGTNTSLLNIQMSQEPTHGVYTGNSVGSTFPTTLTAGYSFDIAVDGGAAATVTLDAGIYATPEVLAQAMQSKINAALGAGSVKVAFNSSSYAFDITSDSWGSGSSVDITAPSGLAISQLGLAAKGISSGVDIQGTINGEAATGAGNVLTGTGPTYTGMTVSFTGKTTSISKSGVDGIITRLENLVGDLLSSDGMIQTRTDGYNKQIDRINEDREALARRLESLEQRYVTQFSAMDALIAQMHSTSDYLANQFAALANLNKSRKS